MKTTQFTDFNGKEQTQYDIEPNDREKDILAVIKYPATIVLILNDQFFLTNIGGLKNYEILSIVNYDDVKRTSVIAERIRHE